MKLDQVTKKAHQESVRLAESGVYSDLTIKCGEKEYPVHKVLVCTRSQFFAKACGGHFQESQTGIIDLSHDDPEAVDAMVCYIYNGCYPRTSLNTTAQNNALYSIRQIWMVEKHGDATAAIEPEFLVLHAKVYALAEKYAVTGLKELATRYFAATIADSSVGEQEIFAEAVEVAYTETIESDRGLRDVIASYLYCYSEVLKKDHVQEVLKVCPSLAFDIVMHHNRVDQEEVDKMEIHYNQEWHPLREWYPNLP